MTNTLLKILPVSQRAFLNLLLASPNAEVRNEGLDLLNAAEAQAKTFSTMPSTNQQSEMGDNAVAYLHYFSPRGDWWITEKDCEDRQLQAFGLARLFDTELGYVDLEDLCSVPTVELDFYWKPKTLAEIKARIGE